MSTQSGRKPTTESTELKQPVRIDGIDVHRGLGSGFTVVQDRWGLRWRADIVVPSGRQAWMCRSAGLRKWLTDEQMADRAPLTYVRTDLVSFSPKDRQSVRAKRQAGEASDADAPLVVLDEDPEDDERFTGGER